MPLVYAERVLSAGSVAAHTRTASAEPGSRLVGPSGSDPRSAPGRALTPPCSIGAGGSAGVQRGLFARQESLSPLLSDRAPAPSRQTLVKSVGSEWHRAFWKHTHSCALGSRACSSQLRSTGPEPQGRRMLAHALAVAGGGGWELDSPGAPSSPTSARDTSVRPPEPPLPHRGNPMTSGHVQGDLQ